MDSKFTGKTIIYGTECGYGAYQYYHHFNSKTDYIEKKDSQGNMIISFAVFAGNEYPTEYLYYSSYKALQAKMAQGYTLNSDERDLYNSILSSLRAKESEAKSKYCGRLYVIIDDNKYFYYTYGNTPSGNGSGSGGGSTSSYEKPELSFVDYDCTTTSLTAKFRINNQNNAKVSTVKGYYGKSNASTSTSATLSGSLITVKVIGLTKGTTYYIQCTATGPGGTATSDQVKLTTLY